MKRLWMVLVLLGLASGAWAQDFIRYTPPPGFLACAAGVFCAPTGTTGYRIPNGTNLEYGEIAWDSNSFYLRTVQNGGTLRNVFLGGDGATGVFVQALSLQPSGSDSRTLGASNNFWTFLYATRGVQGSKSKSLTDAGAAVAVIRVPVATAGFQAGEVIWNTQSTDGTDHRTTEGRIRFAGVNKAGTLTCTVGVIGTDLTASSNANTLACTWTNVVNTTNCDLSVTCTDNTAAAQTMTINFRTDMPTVATLTFP